MGYDMAVNIKDFYVFSWIPCLAKKKKGQITECTMYNGPLLSI